MGRLFKSYYTDMLSDRARDEIKQHVRVTTIDSSSPRHIRKKPRRRESQSRASNSDGTDSEQDIRSQSQSRESASDNDLTDPDIDMIQDHQGTESTSISSRTLAIDESDSSNVDPNVQEEEMNEDDETEQEDHDESMTEPDHQHGTESDESDLVILSGLKPESTQTISDQTKRTTQTRLLELREKGNETIWVCRNCGTHVAHKDDIIAENFYGRSGGACLFVSAMNVTQGVVGHRHLASGEHDCADVFCAFCGAMLGWTYHGARDKHHRYKIGTYCLENKLIDTETHFLDVAKSEVVDAREMDDDDGFEDMVDSFERKVFHKESSVNSLHSIARLRATREFDADD